MFNFTLHLNGISPALTFIVLCQLGDQCQGHIFQKAMHLLKVMGVDP